MYSLCPHQGVTFPAMHSIWAKWAPPEERSRLTTITYAGPHIGTVLSFPISALLIEYGFDGGWPSVFYVFGKYTLSNLLISSCTFHSSVILL